MPRLSVLAVTILGILSFGAPLSATTLTANPPGNAAFMPTRDAHGFEDLTPAHAMSPSGRTYHTWGPWSAFDDAGVTDEGSALMGPTLQAPEGDSVGYGTGTGSLECDYAFPIGVWRLTYEGTQQSIGGTTDAQVLRVSIGGATLAEHEFDASFQPFVTRPIHVTTATTLTVVVKGLDANGTETAFIDRVQLEPVPEWNDTSTWDPAPAAPPGSGDDLTIPVGLRVALTGTCLAQTVIVEGELLVPAAQAPPATTTLDTDWLMVTGADASFTVGTEEVPHLEDFTLTLTGVIDDPDHEMAGTKFLVAQQGATIDLHGAPRVSWTKLAVTVDPPPNPVDPVTLTLVDPVDWEMDDEIVIAGSKNQIVKSVTPYGSDWVDFAEKVTVLSVLGADQIEVDPLQYLHLGGPLLEFPTGAVPPEWTLDMRAEVGLLTHNVKVQGDDTSDIATTTLSKPYGF